MEEAGDDVVGLGALVSLEGLVGEVFLEVGLVAVLSVGGGSEVGGGEEVVHIVDDWMAR